MTSCSRPQPARDEPLSVPGCIKMAAAVALPRCVVVCCGFRDDSIRRVPADAGRPAVHPFRDQAAFVSSVVRMRGGHAASFSLVRGPSRALFSSFFAWTATGPVFSHGRRGRAESSGAALCPTQVRGAGDENCPRVVSEVALLCAHPPYAPFHLAVNRSRRC